MTTLTKPLEWSDRTSETPARPDREPNAGAARCETCPIPDAALVAHIVEQHHAYARRSLPYIVPLLAKVAACHGKRNGKLGALCDVGLELAEILEEHLDEEELELFPALLAGAAGGEVARREIDEMSRHHRELKVLLALIRSLADDFAAPEWGGRSYQVLMEELEALDEDVREHMRLESFVLIPRVSARSANPS